MKNTIWLFIWRLNPPHIGHIWIIEKALIQNEKVLVLLWNSWIIDENNPLTFIQRKELLNLYFWERKNIKIEILEDIISDKKWVDNIYDKITSYSEDKELKFYYWDFQNDSAFNVFKEYQNLFLSFNINYTLVDRSISEIIYNWEKILVSSTNLRKALLLKDYSLALKFCNKEVFSEIKEYF